MNDLLLSNNESCDQCVKSCDQSYLKGVVQLRYVILQYKRALIIPCTCTLFRLLLLMSNNVNSELEKVSNTCILVCDMHYYLSLFCCVGDLIKCSTIKITVLL